MSRRLPITLTALEADALLNAARSATDSAPTPKKQLAAWRDFVMIATGMYAGPRVSELCNFRVENVDLKGRMLAIKHGKGDKDRNVPIAKPLQNILAEWIGERKEGRLFLGPNGKWMPPRTFQTHLAILAKAAGLSREKAHPHILRHYFATSMLKKGVNLRVIQQALGHSSVAVTEIYTHIDDDDLRKAIDLL